jgi:hypothetical protein
MRSAAQVPAAGSGATILKDLRARADEMASGHPSADSAGCMTAQAQRHHLQ